MYQDGLLPIQDTIMCDLGTHSQAGMVLLQLKGSKVFKIRSNGTQQERAIQDMI